jgi:predicted DsbA family dithiol-disulfide isomerase
MSPDVEIVEFTDPGCPWAFSAEPFRRRLDWLYGQRIRWSLRLVGLSESPADYADKGFTPEGMAESLRRIAREHGMPMDTSVRRRMAATLPACRAVVAAKLHAPEAAQPLLRALRVRHFAGELLDEQATLHGAATDIGLEYEQLGAWSEEAATEEALRDDMAAARQPLPAARLLDHKLANWSGGRRYTCPSYEIVRLSDGVRLAVPGFQPFAVYDAVLANLVPGTDRREPAESVEEVLRWAGEPLASREVAVVCEIEHDDAREALARVADERHVGADGYWTLKR